VIARLLEGGPCVVATGGGALCVRRRATGSHDKAVSIWLRADGDVILKRVKRRADRPLLQTADPVATIERLIVERSPFYQLADLAVASRDVPHEKIVDECLRRTAAHLLSGGTSSSSSGT
jgi:shikimate kinase